MLQTFQRLPKFQNFNFVLETLKLERQCSQYFELNPTCVKQVVSWCVSEWDRMSGMVSENPKIDNYSHGAWPGHSHHIWPYNWTPQCACAVSSFWFTRVFVEWAILHIATSSVFEKLNSRGFHKWMQVTLFNCLMCRWTCTVNFGIWKWVLEVMTLLKMQRVL